MRLAAAGLAAAALCGSGGVAPAQPAEAAGAGPVPACAQLAHADGQSRAGIDAGYVFFDEEPPLGGSDLTGWRIEVSGQYVLPSGAGGYAVIPLSHSSIGTGLGTEVDDTSIGNVEVGGLFAFPNGPGVTMVLHAGVTLPTAPEIDPIDLDGFGNAFGLYARMHDLVQHVPEAAYLRGGLAVLWRRGDLFFRGDGGADVPVHNGGMGEASDLPKIGHLDFAGGYAGRDVAVLGELVNVVNLEFSSDEGEDDLIHLLGVTGRYTAARVQPSLSLVMPLDEELREGIVAIVLVGAQALLP